MSIQPCNEPVCSTVSGAVELIIEPQAKDLGGFEIRRALPAAERQTVGPFVFFDHIGPATFAPGQGVEVRPHPHIGLAAVTYLLDGEIMHRDSLGFAQEIRPGAVNWMTAGRGIVHSERTPAPVREAGSRLHGIQAWLALPMASEEMDPDFTHLPAASLPTMESPGLTMRLIAGAVFGVRSPVNTQSPMFYLAATMASGAALTMPDEYQERAVYVLDGQLAVNNESFPAGRMIVFKPGVEIDIRADRASEVMLLGGEPVDAPRYLWWNFVSSSRDRIEQARKDWKSGRFGQVPGETEFIPLPDE